MHPLSLFIYFISVLMIVLINQTPLGIFFSFIVAMGVLIWYRFLSFKQVKHYFILWLLITFINPLIVLKGATVLFYIGMQPYTLEALYYGMVYGLLIVSIFLWSQILNQCINTYHVTYLLSRFFPTLGLLFSMVLRLIPKFKRQYTHVNQMQKMMHPHQPKHFWQFQTLLIMMTWLFESSLTLLQSMNARKYQSKRTHFHLFKWKVADTMFVLIVILLTLMILCLNRYISKFYFYPIIIFTPFKIIDYFFYTCAMILLLLVIYIMEKENQNV
ncbi:MAG: hypothetical protein KHY88_10425 [Erysipelotrichaceae bacterium]|nr:hypothetical protein [Erysipelotrichaceae bacterium]